MEHREVVFGFFLPSNEHAPEAIHPTVCAHRDPAAGFEAGASFDQLSLLAPRADMGREPQLTEQVTDFVKVVSLVQTQVLRFVQTRPRSFSGPALDRFAHQLEVIDLGAGDGQCDRNAVGLGQQTSLGAQFGPLNDRGRVCTNRRTCVWTRDTTLTKSVTCSVSSGPLPISARGAREAWKCHRAPVRCRIGSR